MPHRRSLSITCLTHGIALTAGWLAWSHWQAPAERGTGLEATGTSPQTPSKGTGISTEDLLASLSPVSANNSALKAEAKQNEELDRLLATMEVPEDLAGALNKEIAEWIKDDRDRRKPSPMIMALLYHWASRDAAGMMKWVETDATTREAMMWHSLWALPKAVRDKGPGVLAGGVGNSWGSLFAAHAIAIGLAESEDPAQALALKSTLTDDQWQQVRRQFQQSWPFTQKDTLAKVAIADKQPEILMEFAKRHGAEGMKWLGGQLADDSLDPAFKEQLSNSAAWKDYVRDDSTMPLDQRVKLLAGENQTPSSELYDQIATKDLGAILKNGRDWRNAIRHGEADAAEVLAAMAKELPELAARAPDALRNRLFTELVEEDPERAMSLLDGLPEAEKAQIAMDAAGRAFGNIDPNQFLTALGKIPTDTPELWDARLGAWTKKTVRDHLRLAEDYTAWVRELPPGLDREMALFSLAKSVRTKDAALAAELSGELTDVTLKQRLEEGR
ncbi:hypothetical protein [Haloferula sp. BvORR071]|uniref:hypothetical protein n=1 Tax=Haloferula sp. BvORR071 TaxID=1396141 RepID=UPI0022410349|nr:hypothetical protein [Haloferula sp. BvORR071]